MEGLGRHILVELYDCERDKLDDRAFLEDLTVAAVKASRATIMSTHFKSFEPQGVSGVVVIAESHLSFHTWPEHGYMSLDYFTCGDTIDMNLAVDLIERGLACGHSARKLHWRGAELADMPHRPEGDAAQAREADLFERVDQVSRDEELWTTEYHVDLDSQRRELRLSYRLQGELCRRRSPYQEVVVADTTSFGRALFIDGCMMTNERDEFVYHEMMVHVPAVLHGAPRRVLIVGGGDGGVLREVLRHDMVEHVDLVEMDSAVMEACRQYMPPLSKAFNDSRVHIHLEDGVQYVGKAADDDYDLVLVDSTDPIGPGRALFEQPFYRQVQRILSPGGLFCAQSLCHWLQQPEQEAMYRELGAVWTHLQTFQAVVPTYLGAHWTFALGGLSALDLSAYDRERAKEIAASCRYYTEGLQTAAFALPRIVEENTLGIARAARES